MVSDLPPKAPAAMPWAFCLALMAVGGVALGVPLLWGADQALLSAVSAGVALGGLVTAFAPQHRNWPALAAAVAAAAATLAVPSGGMLVLLAAVFSAGAGLEARQGASRAAIAGLFGWLMFVLAVVPVAPEGADQQLLPGFVAGALWAAFALNWLGASGFAIRGHRAMQDVAAVLLTGYLVIGFLITVAIERLVDHPRAYWFVLLFVLRALPPPGRFTVSALRFAIGATLGAIAALSLEALKVPSSVLLPLSAVLAGLGLRFLPHPWPIAPTCFSAAILMSIATGTDAAIVRIEAIALAAVLTLITTGLAGLLWRPVEREEAEG